MKKENRVYIKIHDDDNVVIIVNEFGVKAGEQITNNVMAIEDIPQAHKASLSDLKKGDPIIRYGAVIGNAKMDIPCGSWIDESRVDLPKAPLLSEMQLATEIPKPLQEVKGLTFKGYVNKDGTVGTKNMLCIMTVVQCVEGVVNIAVERIKKELLPLYKNVDGVMPINHNYGCGVAIDAPEAVIPIRTLRNLAKNPNFGNEMLVVGLGCEKLPPERLFEDIQKDQIVMLQDEHKFEDMIETILVKSKEILERLNQRVRVECPVSELVVGVQCGGSDALSGVTANPAIGYAADLIVRAGGTVMFSEVTEVRDGVHLLSPRALNKQIGQRLIDEMEWYDHYLELGQVGREANTTPGNKKGGLSNIVEKSLGSIAKSGTTAIMDVLSPGERVRCKGLVFAATPASDFICGTLQLASGIGVQVFSTGRGTPYGLKMAPVIKVSSRSELKEKWLNLIDVDAGKIATGEATIEEIGEDIFKLIIQIASGEETTWADKFGIENALCLFNPAPVT